MKRHALSLALACLLALVPAAAVQAEDDVPEAAAPKAPAGPRIAWFHNLTAGRQVAAQTGRPIFVAIHVRPAVASPAATERLERWIKLYRTPEIIDLSREFACVLRVIQAPEGKDPDADQAPAAMHLVVDGTSRVLARDDTSTPAPGARGVEQLRTLLRDGLTNHGPLSKDAPRIDPGMVARTKVDLRGISPSLPVSVPHGVPGVRLRLRWELPTPTLGGAASDVIRATVRMLWDEQGPFDVGQVEFEAGAEIDVPLDLRFDEIEGLAVLATKGKHRVDLYLVPREGSYPFSRGPLHVGRVWIELGDGGGGGGASSDNQEDEESEPDAPPKPQPEPDVGQEPPPPPPPPEREEVVEPFVNEGETVEKEDAVVAVEDPDGGVKPPKQVPLEQALREFEKRKEDEIAREGISARERSFLQRYFELLQRGVKGKAKK